MDCFFPGTVTVNIYSMTLDIKQEEWRK